MVVAKKTEDVTTEPLNLNPVIVALLKAKASFGAIVKDRVNPFHKSKYATLDSVNKAVDSALIDNGLCVVNRISATENGTFVISHLVHISGEFDAAWQESVCPLPDTLDSQKLGAAITYARRYNKLALLDIVADEDDDGNASTKITQPQVATLVALAKKHKWDNDEVKTLIQSQGFSQAADLSLSAYQSVCEEIKSRPIS
jgi:ERF superfamily